MGWEIVKSCCRWDFAALWVKRGRPATNFMIVSTTMIEGEWWRRMYWRLKLWNLLGRWEMQFVLERYLTKFTNFHISSSYYFIVAPNHYFPILRDLFSPWSYRSNTLNSYMFCSLLDGSVIMLPLPDFVSQSMRNYILVSPCTSHPSPFFYLSSVLHEQVSCQHY